MNLAEGHNPSRRLQESKHPAAHCIPQQRSQSFRPKPEFHMRHKDQDPWSSRKQQTPTSQ